VDPERELHLAEGEMLLVDKPRGWTSFDVVNKIRSLFHVRKVGHAGTLDPMATGLLVICSGRKTKELDQFMGLEKEYEGEMILGARTPSFDAETAVSERRSTDDITEERVRSVLGEFVGLQTQVPPMWSAVKVDGRRLYQYARKGQEVARSPREVSIASITPAKIALPTVAITVVCSKGTYIRTLVEDVGQRLGCGAYLTALRRTRIGPYRVDDAFTIEDLVRYRSRAHGAV
jgi:tRNA pseudouridine55 synthase